MCSILGEAVRREVPRVATERLDDAIEQLDAVMAGSADVETAVHDVRKRCKETRGLARLVQPALGDEFRPFDRIVRDAANQLSAMRDAHALLATLDNLLQAHDLDDRLRSVRDHQAALAAEATSAIEAGDERIVAARELLIEARATRASGSSRGGFDPIAEGLTATYRRGRRAMRTAQDDPTDEHMHEWRKSVKHLWYQMRLLRESSPSMIGPLIDELDGLGEALGDDHDLAVLVASLDADPDRFGTPDTVDHARRVACEQQRQLRTPAFRTGAVIYAERPSAFSSRITAYWRPRRPTSDPNCRRAALPHSTSPRGRPEQPHTSTIERERKFLIDDHPGRSRPGRPHRDAPGLPRCRPRIGASARCRAEGVHADGEGRWRRRADRTRMGDRPGTIRRGLAPHRGATSGQGPPPHPARRTRHRARRFPRQSRRARLRRSGVRFLRGARRVRAARVVRAAKSPTTAGTTMPRSHCTAGPSRDRDQRRGAPISKHDERRTALDVGDRTRGRDPTARRVERRGARPLRGAHPRTRRPDQRGGALGPRAGRGAALAADAAVARRRATSARSTVCR